MSRFLYRAFNPEGRTVTGVIDSESVAMAEGQLRQSGLWLLDAQPGDLAEVEVKISRVNVGGRDLVAYFLQMTLLLRAGVTLPNGIRRLADDCSGTKLGIVLTSLHEQIAAGVPLHAAMQTFPRVFPRQISAMVQAGEVSGKLPDIFESLRDYYEWLEQLKADIRQALIYPCAVLGAAIALILVLFLFVVPKFVGLLSDLSLQTPLLTRIVMAISDLLVNGWPVILGLGVGVPVGLKLACRLPEVGRRLDATLLRLPIFGTLLQMFALSRFSQNLALLCRSGIPLLKALEICRSLVGNRAVEHALDDVRRGVSEGVPLSKCLGKSEVFTKTLVTMIATGEASGTLDVSLQSVAAYYNLVIPRRIKAVFSIFDPVMMLTLIALVGCVALAVILPILQLWQAK